MSLKTMNKIFSSSRKEESLKVLAVVSAVAVAIGSESLIAGTSTAFASLEADSSGAIFGPLGQTVIYVASLSGALIAAVKGAWLFAGLGVAVAGLLFAAQSVATGGAFTGII